MRTSLLNIISLMTIKATLQHLFSSIILLILGISGASAQTCRVAAGSTADGMQTFKEVFEYDFVDEKPTFPGGYEALMEYINKTRQYPAEAYEKGIEGRVTCSFVVNADGNITHLKVIKGSHRSLNLEAMRILAEMPCWNPGRHAHRCVPVRVVHCIPFRK